MVSLLIFTLKRLDIMHIDEVVGLIINEFYKQRGTKQKIMSRHKLPCTFCQTMVSPTWRPGPCGTSSLCNACGLLYVKRNDRPRMIDLVISEGRPIWMQRCPETLQWHQSKLADIKDHRIKQWADHEEERVKFVECKKRKFVHL